jgi:glyoxylate reductase
LILGGNEVEKKWKVLVTRYFAGDAWDLLETDCDVTFDPEQLAPMEKHKLISLIKDKDAVISMGDTIDAEVLTAASKLKVIADMGGGGGVDKTICSEKGIHVFGHSIGIDWIKHSEVEHVMMLMLAVGKRLKEADAFFRADKYKHGDQSNRDMLGHGLRKRTIGLIGGAGWSGPYMISVAKGFEMEVTYWCPKPDDKMTKAGGIYKPKEEILEKADYLVLMALMGHGEGYILDKDDFLKMKKTSIIVNVTHGNLINEKELVSALKDGIIGGAGLDKLEKETIMAPGLNDLPNVLLTPHSDGAMKKERYAIFAELVKKTLDVLNKKEAK